MKVGLIGPSYVERSLPFDAQRTINLFPVVDETRQGKEVAALYGTPGLDLLNTIGVGAIRGVFSSVNGRAFVVSGAEVYEISSTYTPTLRGTMSSDVTLVTMDENFTQLFICDQEKLYTLTYSSNAFAEVTDGDLPDAATCTYLDGYTIINKVDSGEFYISALQDATSWDALDFATAESSPDLLVRPFGALGQLWLFGERTTEVWYNSGDLNFPFARINGANMQTGCSAPFSVVSMDNSVFWLGNSQDGKGIVYRAQGYSPQRISTHAIERAINDTGDLSGIRGYTYQQDGHSFYVLTGGNLETTFVYDASTQLWHERAFLEEDGTWSTHLASSCMFAFGKHIVGDRTNGNIYEMSLDVYSDAGNEIKRQRTFTHIHDEAKRFRINELQVDFEYGVGLQSGQGFNPLAWLEISDDGAKTWGSELQASIGAVGNYKTRAVWRKLGYGDLITFRVSISDPVKVSICGAYLK
jgi:hypothetical protein